MEHEDEETMQLFGANLKSIRERTGISLTYLAMATDISLLDLIRAENGEYNVPVLELDRLAEVLGVSMDVLLKEHTHLR